MSIKTCKNCNGIHLEPNCNKLDPDNSPNFIGRTTNNDIQETYTEERDNLAREYGLKIAHPEIRSMYPSESRSVMAHCFAKAFQEGYDVGYMKGLRELGKIIPTLEDNTIVRLEAKIEKLQHELKEASLAGTPYWRERDLQNALVIRNQELERALKKAASILDGSVESLFGISEYKDE